MSWRRKYIARLPKAALSTYMVTCLSCPPKNPEYPIGKKIQNSRVICMRIWYSANSYMFCSFHKLRVLSDTKTEFFSKFRVSKQNTPNLLRNSKHLGYKVVVTEFLSQNFGHKIMVTKFRSQS